jgi:hypothetical protein
MSSVISGCHIISASSTTCILGIFTTTKEHGAMARMRDWVYGIHDSIPFSIA